MTDFRDRYGPWALVAGASAGLGAAFAESLAKRKLNLVLIARRKSLLDELARTLCAKYGIEVHAVELDLGDGDKLEEITAALDVEVGLLVYNAAYAPIGDFTDLEPDQLQRIIDINVTAPLRLTRLLAAPMQTRQRGGIVLMSSLAGDQGSPRIATYAASKAFNSILAEGLWAELNRAGVDVIASRAGAIRTPGYLSTGTSQAPGTLDASVVAEQTLDALGSAPSVVPGLVNQLAHFALTRLMPRKAAISIMGRNTRDLQ